ncbi:hypothetical protein VDG1235_239 [Verrucomicrobiia bacterium DG1235]|nr:hypothetical protein VDG1235_239 [Verrucomicrobiae bacterium DG1235]
MKPLLITTACLITATIVCADISNDELNPDHQSALPTVQAMESKASISPNIDFTPSMYGVCGALAMATVIASRRSKAQI